MKTNKTFLEVELNVRELERGTYFKEQNRQMYLILKVILLKERNQGIIGS
jgi:hypothetical protein